MALCQMACPILSLWAILFVVPSLYNIPVTAVGARHQNSKHFAFTIVPVRKRFRFLYPARIAVTEAAYNDVATSNMKDKVSIRYTSLHSSIPYGTIPEKHALITFPVDIGVMCYVKGNLR